MKTLFISTSPTLPQLIGGAQWSLHYFAEGLKSFGHQVFVLSALRNVGWLGFRNKVTRALTKRTFPVDRSMGYPTARGWDLQIGLEDHVAFDRPDVVIVVGIGSQPMPCAIKVQEMGIPVIYLAMDVGFENHGAPLSQLKNGIFVANSKFTATRMHQLFGCESTVIYPPINVARCKVTNSGKKVVMVNPQRSKGGLIALAMAKARPKIPFVFYESWSGDISDIRQQASELPNVEWRMPVLDPRKVYEEARILLVPSQAEEAWGMVASEAQCSGIPVIGSSIGGLIESIGDGGICIAPDAAIEIWLQALDKLWCDSESWLKYSSIARARAQRQEICMEFQISQLDKILQQTVGLSTH